MGKKEHCLNWSYLLDITKTIIHKIIGVGAITIIFFNSCSDQKGDELTVESENKEEPKNIEADPMKNKGIGPVQSIELGALDIAMASEGEQIYIEKCSACHKPYKKYIGPAPVGILERRTPEWIMNMILNPEEMVKKDPIAKELLAKFPSPMANQNLTEEQARKVLEYFRTLENK